MALAKVFMIKASLLQRQVRAGYNSPAFTAFAQLS
jgi:hypothetical protein